MNFLINRAKKLFESKDMSSFLSIENLENSTKKQIRISGLNFKPSSGTAHKKNTLLSGIKIQNNYDIKLQNIVSRLIKKLEIDRDVTIDNLMFSLERREFTNRRVFKNIETPFRGMEEYKNLQAIFVYKNTKIYNNEDKGLKKILNADLYLFHDRMVWWDNVFGFIVKVIELKDIYSISNTDYGIGLETKHSKLMIRYVDNEVMFISLYRMYKKVLKGNVK